MENIISNRPLCYLVEDDADDQYMFKMIIEELRINVDLFIFEHGLAVYDELITQLSIQDTHQRSRLPDLILLDLNLPIWDGKRTLKRIKSQDDLKTIPTVIYTTSKSEHDRRDCFELGANSFISKAAEYDKLSVQIRNIFTYWFDT